MGRSSFVFDPDTHAVSGWAIKRSSDTGLLCRSTGWKRCFFVLHAGKRACLAGLASSPAYVYLGGEDAMAALGPSALPCSWRHTLSVVSSPPSLPDSGKLQYMDTPGAKATGETNVAGAVVAVFPNLRSPPPLRYVVEIQADRARALTAPSDKPGAVKDKDADRTVVVLCFESEIDRVAFLSAVVAVASNLDASTTSPLISSGAEMSVVPSKVDQGTTDPLSIIPGPHGGFNPMWGQVRRGLHSHTGVRCLQKKRAEN